MNLAHRAEEGLLGALLYDPSLAADVPYLRPSDFAHPDHQILYEAFTDLLAEDPGLYGAALTARIVERHPDVDEHALRSLALNGPDVSSVAVVGRMVQEAALRRELAVHADRLAQAAGSTRGVDPDRDHLALLAEALRAHSHTFTDPEMDVVATQAAAHDLRALREEQLLADLIQHPGHIREVAGWLDDEVFTSAARRDIYRAVVQVERYGEPVGELTLAWELARSRDLALSPEEEVRADIPPAAPGYVARLAATSVVAGASVEIGRDLLADHIRADARTTQVSVVTDHTFRQETRRTYEKPTPLLARPTQPNFDSREMRQ